MPMDLKKIPFDLLEILLRRGLKVEAIAEMTPADVLREYEAWHGVVFHPSATSPYKNMYELVHVIDAAAVPQGLYTEVSGNIDDTPGKMAVTVTFKTPTEAIPVRGPTTEQGYCTPNELNAALEPDWGYGTRPLFKCDVEKIPGGGVTLTFTEVKRG